jgi:hypothetical protein
MRGAKAKLIRTIIYGDGNVKREKVEYVAQIDHGTGLPTGGLIADGRRREYQLTKRRF